MNTKQKKAKMLAEIMVELHFFFDSDIKKVTKWLTTRNLNLGGCTPMQLIEVDKVSKLHEFVMASFL